MPLHLSLDFETYSACPLGGTNGRGLANYARDPSTDVICLAWAAHDEEPKLWLPTDPIPEVFLDPQRFDVHWHAWNIAFEVAIMRHVLGWPVPPLTHQHDTMAKARVLGLPGRLGNCARIMRLPDNAQKDVRGRHLITKLSMPQRDGKRNRDPELLQEMYDYCVQDVVVEREIDRLLLDLSPSEARVWEVDQRINERGIPVDVPNVRAAIEIGDAIMAGLDERLRALTGVKNPNSNSQFRDWLNTRGVAVEDVKRDTLTRLLAADTQARRFSYARPHLLSRDVRAALVAFGHRKKTTIAKYHAFNRLASSDGRVRGCFQYAAANTGRWASWGVNTQNLARPARGLANPNGWIDHFHKRDPDQLGADSGFHPIDVLGSAVRGHIKAREGHRLLVADFSSIEAAVTAFMAREAYLMDIFEGDGQVYEAQAAAMFDIPVERVSSHQRLLGKVAVLALGFAGGVGAFRSMGEVYGLKHLPEHEAQGYVDAYRAANPAIAAMWRSIEHGALNAINYPKTWVSAANGYLHWMAEVTNDSEPRPFVLYLRLPSGRLKPYWSPRLVEGKFGNVQLEFSGLNPTTRQWGEHAGWRGLLTENAVQAIARDLLANALLQLDNAGYRVVMHVHDEIVCEQPDGTGSLDEMIELMCRVPPWFEGFPLRADGYEAMRYRKD